MSLLEQLKAQGRPGLTRADGPQQSRPDAAPSGATGAGPAGPAARPGGPAAPAPAAIDHQAGDGAARSPALTELKFRIHEELIRDLDPEQLVGETGVGSPIRRAIEQAAEE